MLILKGLVLVTAFINSASAFFPYFPPYRCTLDGDCSASENDADSQVESRGEGFTLKLFQRVPEIEIPHAVQARNAAQRSKRKYNRAGRPNGIERRTNTFSVVKAATPSQANSTGIDQDGTDFSYFAAVTVGSNKTPLYMLLDTGAGTSWVMGNECSSNACLNHDTFGSDNSTTIKLSTETFSIAYGSGTVAGTVCTDTLTIAGITLSMNLGLANETSSDFNHFPFDGILGLSQSVSNNPNFLQTLIASKSLTSNVFGVALDRESDGDTNSGEINFGAPDTSRYSGGLSYFPVSSEAGGDWAIPLSKVGNGTASSAISGTLGYVDTGTSFIFTSPADAATFHSMIPGANSSDGGAIYTVPCNTTADATFTFGSTTFSVSPKDWVSPKSNGGCTSNIYGQDIVSGNWLLGDTFIKNVYALFDADQDRLGLAQRIVTATSSSATSTGTSSFSSSLSTTTTPIGTTTSLEGTITTATVSNGKPTGTSSSGSSNTATATTTTSGSSSTDAPSTGMDGHESSSTPNTAAAETASPSASTTASKKSDGNRQGSHLFSLALATLVLVMIS